MKQTLMRWACLVGLLSGSLAYAQTNGQTVNSGSITSTQCVSVDVTQRSTVGIHVEGTWTGTLQPSVAMPGSLATKDNIQVTPGTSSTAQSTITANGFYQARIAGTATFFLCGNTVSSGTASITLYASSGVSAGSGGGGSSPNATPNQSAWYVSRNCNGATNCTTVKADGRYIIDGTSNSTTTFTCPNNDCNFTSADVGKTFWATTQNSGTSIDFLIYTTYVCPVTTIAAVNSAQNITLNVACTANGTANVVAYWATDDGSALAGLDAAVGCSVVYLPDSGVAGNYMLDSKPFLVNAPSASTCLQQMTTIVGAPAPALVGTGFGASQSIIMIHPSFDWANCKAITGASLNVCIGGTARTLANIQIVGSGLTSASNSGCAGAANKILVSASPVSSTIYGVDVAGVCPGASNMEGIEVNSYDESFDLGGVQEVGQYACVAYNAKSVTFREDDCHNVKVGSTGFGLKVKSNAQMNDIGTYPYVNVQIDAGSSLRSFGTHFFGDVSNGAAPAILLNGTWISYGDFVNESGIGGQTDLVGVQVNSGGVLQAMNTLFSCAGAGCGPIYNNGGSVISQGGNSFTVGIPSAVTGAKYWGADVLSGTAQGVCTAASTLGFYGFGQSAAITCTSTTVNLGKVMTQPTLSAGLGTLVVSAGTGGTNASSGVVTILKNGVATAITCTLGTGTFCDDQTHTVAVAAGDVISAQVTTQAADTLANVKITLLDW
jgi:hypothetical protein